MHQRVRSILLFLLDVVLNVVVIVALAFFIRAYIFFPFKVEGPSMCDTFNNFEGRCIRTVGDYILVYKLGYLDVFGWQIGLPERGDIVVFHPPESDDPEEFFIKRVIGLPGDTVSIRDGYVYITNDVLELTWKLDESDYLTALNWGHTEVTPGYDRFVVPEGKYFVLGDNRRVSSDSRRCFVSNGCSTGASAFVPLDEIQGRAWVVIWPFSRVRVVEHSEFVPPLESLGSLSSAG